MGKQQRDKGLRVERKLLALLREAGIPCERVPLSGATHYRGNGADIDAYIRGRDQAPWVGECKARGNGEGFALIQRWLGEADFLALMADRADPLIVVPWSRWIELLGLIRRA